VNPDVLVKPAAAVQLLPAEFDPAVALDEPLMQLVGPAGLRTTSSSSSAPGHAACRQHNQQQQRRQSSQRRRRASTSASNAACSTDGPVHDEKDTEAEDEGDAESATAGSCELVGSKKELRSSHVLMALDAWLDEV
jgi:hypothetical protein